MIKGENNCNFRFKIIFIKESPYTSDSHSHNLTYRLCASSVEWMKWLFWGHHHHHHQGIHQLQPKKVLPQQFISFLLSCGQQSIVKINQRRTHRQSFAVFLSASLFLLIIRLHSFRSVRFDIKCWPVGRPLKPSSESSFWMLCPCC